MADTVTPPQTSKRRPVVRLRASPILVGVKDAARMIGVSPTHFRRLDSQGKLGPVGIRLGGRVLWSVGELKSWADVGCPDRVAWDKKKKGVTWSHQE